MRLRREGRLRLVWSSESGGRLCRVVRDVRWEVVSAGCTQSRPASRPILPCCCRRIHWISEQWLTPGCHPDHEEAQSGRTANRGAVEGEFNEEGDRALGSYNRLLGNSLDLKSWEFTLNDLRSDVLSPLLLPARTDFRHRELVLLSASCARTPHRASHP